MSWQNLFTQKNLDKGYAFFQQKRIERFEFENDEKRFDATVKGDAAIFYRVLGCLDLNGKVTELSCSCPWSGRGRYCAHEVAALLMAEEMQKDDTKAKVKLVELVPDEVWEDAENSDISGNPLKIVSN